MRFSVFQATPLPVDRDAPEYTGVLEQNFSSIQQSIISIGEDLGSIVEKYLVLPANASLAAGDLCVLGSSGMVKADASAASTGTSLLGIATAAVASGMSGKFLVQGLYNTTGLTLGDVMYLSTTAGAFTATAPSSSTEVVRVIGYATSTTQLFFDPSKEWSIVP